MNTDIPEYVLGILSQGDCPALVRGGRFYYNQVPFVVQDTSGLINLEEYLVLQSIGSLKLIMLLKAYYKALDCLKDWLVPFDVLDYDMRNIWISPDDYGIRFCLKKQFNNMNREQTDIPAQIYVSLAICDAATSPNSEVIKDKIKTAVCSQRFDNKAICKLLDSLAERCSRYSFKRELTDNI